MCASCVQGQANRRVLGNAGVTLDLKIWMGPCSVANMQGEEEAGEEIVLKG
jgi:hypothetical protein